MTVTTRRFLSVTVVICICLISIVLWLDAKYDLIGLYYNSYAPQKQVFLKIEKFPDPSNARLNFTASSTFECPTNTLLCGEKVPGVTEQQLSNIGALKATFHSLMTDIDFQCPGTQRFGREGDGGYEACMTKAIAPNSGSCLVYSFGISKDWSFDEAFAKYGCEVHSFDPSIGKKDHLHSPNVTFHDVGLWGCDIVNRHGWKLERLSTIRKRLGHEMRIIDVLKVDVEGAEWPFLRDMTFGDLQGLSKVKQLLVELHTPRFRPEAVTAVDFGEINVYAGRLRDLLGFRLFKNVQRNYCCGRFSDLMPEGVIEKCCHEVFYFNSHLLGK